MEQDNAVWCPLPFLTEMSKTAVILALTDVDKDIPAAIARGIADDLISDDMPIRIAKVR